ncbi:hypothetical protein [Rhodoplanes azumiensis]|uniref:Anti sigma-E protein RseA N-terminal domain-containing protein n=1 Tax=Rhodoplanes azumiensis TaxID=1897628 RepID=A0ABW5ARP5_9BRAD
MTFTEFRRLAETYGGDVARWPEATRDAARAIARTPEGRAVLAAERRLDLMLEEAPEVPRRRADDLAFAVMQRLATAPPATLVQRPGGPPSGRPIGATARGWLRWLVPAASLACSLLVGVSLAREVPYAVGPSPAATIIAMVVDAGAIPNDWGRP